MFHQCSIVAACTAAKVLASTVNAVIFIMMSRSILIEGRGMKLELEQEGNSKMPRYPSPCTTPVEAFCDAGVRPKIGSKGDL
jgi:hypothetical protein